MSNQPTQLERSKAAIASAANTVAQKLQPDDPNYDADKDPANFKKDALGNVHKKGDYKDQLNTAAFPETETEKTEGLLEKVAAYIPGLGTSEPNEAEKGDELKEGGSGGPPNRPDHDEQVEQFLREQYHSRSGDGMPDPDKDN